MNLLKKRAVAIVIAILAVLLSTVLSARSGLLGSIREVEMLYYKGVEATEGNYMRPSIDSQMRVKYNSANSILGIIGAYAELGSVAEDLRNARDYVHVNLGDYDEDTVSGMSWANQELEAVLTRLQLEMSRVEFTEREAQMLESCFADIEGAQRMIEQSGYNEAVRAFNTKDLQRFPANLLLGLQSKYADGAAYFG